MVQCARSRRQWFQRVATAAKQVKRSPCKPLESPADRPCRVPPSRRPIGRLQVCCDGGGEGKRGGVGEPAGVFFASWLWEAESRGEMMALPGVSSLWRANDQGGQHALKDPLQGELCLGPSGRQCHWRHTGPAAGRHNETRQLGSRAHSEQCAESNQSQPGAGGGGSAGDEQRAGPQASRHVKGRVGWVCAYRCLCFVRASVVCERQSARGRLSVWRQ